MKGTGIQGSYRNTYAAYEYTERTNISYTYEYNERIGIQGGDTNTRKG
jgi:hypothetical protein